MNTCMQECSDDVYDMVEQKLMRMTFWAHKEVLFEKIKDQIEKQEGEKLENLAKLLVETSRERTQAGKTFDKKQEELREKIGDLLEE